LGWPESSLLLLSMGGGIYAVDTSPISLIVHLWIELFAERNGFPTACDWCYCPTNCTEHKKGHALNATLSVWWDHRLVWGCHIYNELTLWSWTLLERPLDVRPLDSFPAFHGTRRFNTEFTTAPHLFLSFAKKSVQVRGSLEVFVTSFFYSEGLLTPRPTSKLEGHTLLSVYDCLFNIFAANLHIWRPFLHPQPEDAPCCGDRDPT
jgi:hypothetical protein